MDFTSSNLSTDLSKDLSKDLSVITDLLSQIQAGKVEPPKRSVEELNLRLIEENTKLVNEIEEMKQNFQLAMAKMNKNFETKINEIDAKYREADRSAEYYYRKYQNGKEEYENLRAHDREKCIRQIQELESRIVSLNEKLAQINKAKIYSQKR